MGAALGGAELGTKIMATEAKTRKRAIAYLKLKLNRLNYHAKYEICSSIRAELKDRANGYAEAIKDLENWFDPEFELDIDEYDLEDFI